MGVEHKEILLSEFSFMDISRFWGHIDKKSENECWLWTKTCITRGEKLVPVFSYRRGKKMAYSARLAYFFHYKEDPGVLCVCHACDAPMCMNPNHLWLGTSADNTKDRDIKGRTAKGERQWHAKLTTQKVHEIRNRYLKGETQQSIADSLNIDQTHVSRIVLGKSWNHI